MRLNQKTHFFTDVNDHFLNSEGDMSCYLIDEEHNSCLDTDEDCIFHLDTVQDQRSMRNGPLLKQAIRCVDIELRTREQCTVHSRKSSHYLVLNNTQ